MKRLRIALGIMGFIMTFTSHAHDIPLNGEWAVQNLSKGRYSVSSDSVVMNPKERGTGLATLSVPGPFGASDLLRFSADVETRGVRDGQGRDKIKPYSINNDLHGASVVIAQLDAAGKVVGINASARLLGTEQHRLSVETPLQENVVSLKLQLRAVDVTGAIRFQNMKLEQPVPPPLNPLPEARVLKNENGSVYLQVDGQTLPWAMYFGNNQFNRDERILEELEMAVPAGVRMISFNMNLPSLTSNEEQLAVMERFLKPFPNVYFMPRVWLGAGSFYREHNPDQVMEYLDGKKGPMANPASEDWKVHTDHNLRELIKLIRRSPYAGQFIGLKLIYHQTGEWIMWDPFKPAGFDEITRRGFINWLKERHETIEDLAAHWHTPLSSFEDVTVPSMEEREKSEIGLFRDPATQQREIDFSIYYNTMNADTISRFGRTVKEATESKSLVGTFYGYLFELAWTGSWPQQAGHLGLEKLFQSPYVDIIGAPYSYHPAGRGFGLPVDVHGPFDGANFMGKAVMLEEDTFTHLADKPAPGAHAPGYDSRTKNMKETLAVLRRNLGVNIAHNQLHLWQNLFSEGRFNDPLIWNMYRPYLEWMRRRAEHAPVFSPDVAVLADPSAVSLLKNNAYSVTERWLYQNRFFLNRTDANIGWYHQSELKYLPDTVRCLVLLNPYRITPEQQAILKERFMRDGRMIVFCYMPNIFDESGFNPEGMDITGQLLHLRKTPIMPYSMMTDAFGAAYEGLTFGRDQYGAEPDSSVTFLVSPHIEVQDPDSVVLARYVDSGEASCTIKSMGDWNSVYLGSSALPVPIWRALFERAGVHLYLTPASEDFDKPDFVEASKDFVMVQSAMGGPKTVHLPHQQNRIFRFDSFPPQLIATSTNQVDITLKPGVPTYLLLQ